MHVRPCSGGFCKLAAVLLAVSFQVSEEAATRAPGKLAFGSLESAVWDVWEDQRLF